MNWLETLATSFVFVAFSVVVTWLYYLKGYFRLPFQTASTPKVTLVDLFFCFGIIFMLLNAFVFPFILAFLKHYYSLAHTSNTFPIIVFLSSLLSFASLILYSYWIPKKERRAIWKDTSFPGAKSLSSDLFLGLLTLFIACTIVFTVGFFLELLITKYIGPIEKEQVAVLLLKQSLSSPVAAFCMFSLITILAPLIEEFLFRGLLQNWLKPRLGTLSTILVTAFVFSLVHFSPSQKATNYLLLPSLFLFALFSSFLYEKTRSLFAPIVLHVTFNSISVIRIIFN